MLVGCSTRTVYETIPLNPPASLLTKPTQLEEVRLDTENDVVVSYQHLVDLYYSLSDQLTILIDWIEKHQNLSNKEK